MSAAGIRLEHDAWGRLVLTLADGARHVGVEAVRAFPVADPTRHISILDADGREAIAIDDLRQLDPDVRQVLEEELTRRHFLPTILRIVQVKGRIQPTEWEAETDRGPVRFTLKSDEDVRRMPNGRVIIADAQGVRYMIPHVDALDAASRRHLDRYLW